MDWFLSPVKPQVESVSEPEPQSDTIEDLLGYDINLVKNVLAQTDPIDKEIKFNDSIITETIRNIKSYIGNPSIYSQPIPIRAIQDGTVPFRLGNEDNIVIYLPELPTNIIQYWLRYAENRNIDKNKFLTFTDAEKDENNKYEFALFVVQQLMLDIQLIQKKKQPGFSYNETGSYYRLHNYYREYDNYNQYSPFLLVSSNHEEPIRTVWVNLVEDEPNTKTSFPEKTPEELAEQFSLSKFASEEALKKSKSIQYVFPDNDYVKKVSHNTLFVDMVLSGVKEKKETTWLRTKTKLIPYNDSYYFIIPKRINVYQKFVAKYTTSVRSYNDSDPNFTWNDVVEKEIEIGNGKYLLLERIDGGYTNDNGDIFHWKDNYGNYYNLHNKQKIPNEEWFYYQNMDEKLRKGDGSEKHHIDHLYGGGNKRKKRKTRKPSKKRKTNKSRRVQKQK